MSKKEEKLNRLWNEIQRTAKEEDLRKLNMRAFLYSVGRLSFEQVLTELIAFKLGFDPMSEEVKALVNIIEGDKAI